MRAIFTLIMVLNTVLLCGCVRFSKIGSYREPLKTPKGILDYYDKKGSYSSYELHSVLPFKNYSVKRYIIYTEFGQSTVDFFSTEAARKKKTDNLVFVFPILGGKNIIENYFADYFARRGIDTAIIHRDNAFKKPENLDKLEQLLRENVIRDRIVMDFFEDNFGKKKFGSFGISRGAINVAMTAGIDSRLKSNVLVLGGTDLVGIFMNSSENRIRKYIKKVTKDRLITKEKFKKVLKNQLKTDPKLFTKFIDPKHTLLVLATLDTTVPFDYGLKLREEIGSPETIFLLADHFTSLLYTQILKVFPLNSDLCVFPFDYIESEVMDFYSKEFGLKRSWWKGLFVNIVQTPLNVLASGIRSIVHYDEERTIRKKKAQLEKEK